MEVTAGHEEAKAYFFAYLWHFQYLHLNFCIFNHVQVLKWGFVGGENIGYGARWIASIVDRLRDQLT